MVSTSFLRLTLLILFIDATTGYEITSDTTVDKFPIQVPYPNDDSKFLRIFYNGTTTELQCPRGYVFSKSENHCVKSSDPDEDEDICLKLGLPEGNNPNPDNCQTYFGCNSACCFLMNCSANLLYNKLRDQCLYPRETQCCEYVEKNPSRLVQ